MTTSLSIFIPLTLSSPIFILQLSKCFSIATVKQISDLIIEAYIWANIWNSRKYKYTLQVKLLVLPIMHLCLTKPKSVWKGEQRGKHYGQLENRFWRGWKTHLSALTHKRRFWLNWKVSDRGKGCCKEGITSHLPPPHQRRGSEEVSAASYPLAASCPGFWLTQTCRIPWQRMRKKDKAICFHKEATGGWGEHRQQTTNKNVRQLMRFPNKKVKYADAVSNSSPATDVTGIVNSKCFYLI